MLHACSRLTISRLQTWMVYSFLFLQKSVVIYISALEGISLPFGSASMGSGFGSRSYYRALLNYVQYNKTCSSDSYMPKMKYGEEPGEMVS